MSAQTSSKIRKGLRVKPYSKPITVLLGLIVLFFASKNIVKVVEIIPPTNGEESNAPIERTYEGRTTADRRKKAIDNTIVDKRKVTRLSLIGERHSGTNWMTKHLVDCFNSTELFVTDDLTRYKHWFQSDRIDRTEQEHEPEKTVVVALFRNVYQWVESMRAKPHHSPEHWNMEQERALPWEKFVTTPWTMPRTAADKTYLKKQIAQGKTSTTTVKCQANFSYREMNSCVVKPYDENTLSPAYVSAGAGLTTPKYELLPDGSGRAFNSIIDLRAAKIENFLSVAEYDFVSRLLLVRYEDLKFGGTEVLLREIETETGVKANCRATPAQSEDKVLTLPEGQIGWLNEFVNWEVENLIGYLREEI